MTINGIAKAGIIHKPFFVHSGNTSRTYLGTVETGAYSTTNLEHMGDLIDYNVARALHYLVPFKEIDKESRSSILFSGKGSEKFNN